MIKSLTIDNFQSHEHTEFKFKPGLNIIVGATDSGKSAAVRALKWVLFNRPTGNAFRSWWGGDVSVKLSTTEGSVIRIKSKKELYIVEDVINDNVNELTAFGVEVPEEVTNFLKMEDLNFQYQINSPFLISETPGKVSQYFNRVARLEIMDKASSAIRKDIAEASARIKSLDIDIKSEEQNAKQYAELPKWEAELEVLEELEIDRNRISKNLANLKAVLSEIETIESEVQKLFSITEIENKYTELLALNTAYVLQSDKIETLRELIEHSSEVKNPEIEALVASEEKVNQLLSDLKTYKIQETSTEALRQLLYNIKEIEKEIEKSSEQLGSMETEFKESMPDVCPLCDSKIKHKHK